MGDGNHLEDVYVFPTGAETIAVLTDPDGDTSYITNTYIVINTDTNAPTYAIRHTGDTDMRLYNSFIYARNPNAGGSAATYNFHSTGAAGDLEIKQVHAKTSCSNNLNCNLTLNDSSASGTDIIFSGSWAAFNDPSPVAATNNNASGQIKLDIQYENDNSDYANYTTSGNNVVVNPLRADKIVIYPGTGLTSGDLAEISFLSATTQTAALTGLNVDFSNLASVAGSTTYGLLINDLATQTSSTEYAIYQEGTNWDLGALFADAVQLGENGADGQLVLYNELGTTDFTTTFNLSDSQAANIVYTLPPDDGGADNYVLTTNGSGLLQWESVTGAGGGTGTITAVGNITSGDAFTSGTPGAQFYLTDGGLIDFNGAGNLQYGNGSDFTIRDDGTNNIFALKPFARYIPEYPA